MSLRCLKHRMRNNFSDQPEASRFTGATPALPIHRPRANWSFASTTYVGYANVVHRFANTLRGQLPAFLL